MKRAYFCYSLAFFSNNGRTYAIIIFLLTNFVADSYVFTRHLRERNFKFPMAAMKTMNEWMMEEGKKRTNVTECVGIKKNFNLIYRYFILHKQQTVAACWMGLKAASKAHVNSFTFRSLTCFNRVQHQRFSDEAHSLKTNEINSMSSSIF
jgi:hypothetical protein